MKHDDFYLAFENEFRGSKDLISERLQFYCRFLLPLLDYYHKGNAVDLGVGRGEWLHILRMHGLDETGIDMNQSMINECIAAGLNVKLMDARTFLKSTADNSQLIISAFHLLEHLEFSDVLDTLQQSLRSLKPGGVFIAETPNPDNIAVGANRFYVDPTHQRPIPFQLLEFAAKYVGFSKVKIVNLQEPPWLNIKNHQINLNDVLCNVSPDYGIIAVKDGPHDILDKYDQLFAINFGLSLAKLTSIYDQRIQEMENSIGTILGMINRPSRIQRVLDHITHKTRKIMTNIRDR
jgi:O-antigen chain-terminating methyltransferase